MSRGRSSWTTCISSESRRNLVSARGRRWTSTWKHSETRNRTWVYIQWKGARHRRPWRGLVWIILIQLGQRFQSKFIPLSIHLKNKDYWLWQFRSSVFTRQCLWLAFENFSVAYSGFWWIGSKTMKFGTKMMSKIAPVLRRGWNCPLAPRGSTSVFFYFPFVMSKKIQIDYSEFGSGFLMMYSLRYCLDPGDNDLESVDPLHQDWTEGSHPRHQSLPTHSRVWSGGSGNDPGGSGRSSERYRRTSHAGHQHAVASVQVRKEDPNSDRWASKHWLLQRCVMYSDQGLFSYFFVLK